MDIFAFAARVNNAAASYEVGDLQRYRAMLHRKKARTLKLFSPQCTFPTEWGGYAFHDGGRTELQYNLGYYTDERRCRYGVAFSFEKSQSLPDPESLWPKVTRFNKWVRENGKLLKGFKMWHWDPRTEDRSSERAPGEIPRELAEAGTFVFLGTEVPQSKLDVGRVLTAFDTLYPLYQFVESGS
jgi:hypothetical protein